MDSLTGKFLIAMPGMGDPRFDRAVILMCDHSEDGALGLIINKPNPNVSVADVLQKLEIIGGKGLAGDPKVYFGGPVDLSRGFVLHGPEYVSENSTLEISSGVSLTATSDILEDLARGRGPEVFRIMLGYSGWGPGQLEAELQTNGWLTTDARSDLVFHGEEDQTWTGALALMGIDPLILSSDAGRA